MPLDRASPLRVVVKAVNWVGDAVITTPALRHLRQSFPHACITVIARPWVAPVYAHNPDIDQLWEADDAGSARDFLRAVARIRRERFDLGIAFPNSLRAALLLKLGMVRHRVGYAAGPRRLLLNRPVRMEPRFADRHQLFHYLHLVESVSAPTTEPPRLVLRAGTAEQTQVVDLLEHLGIDGRRPLIGLAPGSINSHAKRWPVDRFASLADRLARAADAEILLLGSPRDGDVLDRVASRCASKVHNLNGTIDLGRGIALVERLTGLICNDSGAMHLAAALDVPTVAIFGPTDSKATYPFSESATMVRCEVGCSPCMLRSCPGDHQCMTGITVDEVFDAFMQTVGSRRPPATNPA